jgi:hypothetical protein
MSYHSDAFFWSCSCLPLRFRWLMRPGIRNPHPKRRHNPGRGDQRRSARKTMVVGGEEVVRGSHLGSSAAPKYTWGEQLTTANPQLTPAIQDRMVT